MGDAGLGDAVAPGEVKFLRIMEQPAKFPQNETHFPRNRVYEMSPVMGRRCYYVKRCLGVVPVEEDGSARFTVPAFRELYFQALDGEGRAIQSMGSAVNVAPGDLVVADIDGVVVVPSEAALEVGQLAVEKATTETQARELLEGGAYLRDAWQRFKVL